MAKPKIALYWAAGCGGCDVAVLDTNEKILDIAALADIVFWPIALDFKYHHVEAMKDGEIDLVPVQRRHPQLGAGAPRQAAAGEVQGDDGLWRVRLLRAAYPPSPISPRKTRLCSGSTATSPR